MKSRFLNAVKHKTFIPFPDIGYGDGCSILTGDTFYNTSDMCRNKPIEYFKNGTCTTWKWSGNDSKQKYFENLKTQPEDWYYRNNSVTYTLNSFGYRTKQFDEIDWENSIVMFGCSFVSGVGVDDKHTIGSFLENELGIEVINMGVAGSSIQFHIYNSILLSSNYPTPKAVIYSWSGLNRYPFYTWKDLHHRGHWSDTKGETEKNISNYVTNNVIAVNNIRCIWENKTKFIEYTMDKTTFDIVKSVSPSKNTYFFNKYELMYGNDYGRDLSHYGKMHNYTISKKLSSIYKLKK
jgi:hypothetical protein